MGRASHQTRRRYSGLTSLLAMLYLVLIGTLAIGFYAATNTASEVASNDMRMARAQFAAESGLSFMRYQFANVKIPASAPSLFDSLYTQLGNDINNTANMPSGVTTISRSTDGNTIYIPAKDKFIAADSQGNYFRAEVVKEDSGEVVKCTVYGKNKSTASSIDRGIVLKFGNHPNPSSIFDYGLATPGTISLSSTSHITNSPGTDPALGSVLTTNSAAQPIRMSGGIISGSVAMSSTGTINWSGAPLISGLPPTKWSSTGVVKTGMAPPVWPSINTAPFEDYLTAYNATHSPTIITGSPTGSNFTNIRIKAGANPTFPSGSTVTGVVVVELPNKVSFSGSATLNGIIVANNSAGGATVLNTNNGITFSGSVTAHDPSYLTPANGYNATDFGALQKLGGAIILAPTFLVTFSGSSNSMGGTIAGSKLVMSGSSGGSIDGMVMIMDNQPTVFSGSAGINIHSKGTAGFPAGMRFGSNYNPLPNTYAELSN